MNVGARVAGVIPGQIVLNTRYLNVRYECLLGAAIDPTCHTRQVNFLRVNLSDVNFKVFDSLEKAPLKGTPDLCLN